MINIKKLRLVLRYYWDFFYKYKIYFEGMLDSIVYEWAGVNSHSRSWLSKTVPGLYKQNHQVPIIKKVAIIFLRGPLGVYLYLN